MQLNLELNSPSESNFWIIGSTRGRTVHNETDHDHTEPTMVSFISTFETQHFHQTKNAVEAILCSTCVNTSMDIAEVWLRTGPRTHQLVYSHLRPTTVIDESMRRGILDVYHGEKSGECIHRLSPALCKLARDTMDVVWVTAQSEDEAQALRASLNNVQTAVAIPVCHEASNTNITFIYFSFRKAIGDKSPELIELLVHMSLAAAIASSDDPKL